MKYVPAAAKINRSAVDTFLNEPVYVLFSMLESVGFG